MLVKRNDGWYVEYVVARPVTMELSIPIDPKYEEWCNTLVNGHTRNYDDVEFDEVLVDNKVSMAVLNVPLKEPQKSDEEIKRDIGDILAHNIHFSGQVDGYVIHGAIDKIIEYFKKLNHD